jgi:F-type H+-transporting ATPase subunit epsilon
MAKTFHVDIVSAEASIFSGERRCWSHPGEGGELGILPEHIPLLTASSRAPSASRARAAARRR